MIWTIALSHIYYFQQDLFLSTPEYFFSGLWPGQFQTLQLGHPFLCGRHKASRSRPWRQSKFHPAEPWLTLRKVSRDPFSMNSVMIITGLPTGTQHMTAVNEAKLQRRNTQTIKRRGQRRSRVCSCDQPLSPSPCSSLGDNMACRHQSHWQLLINPLHKRQEIIRMDQSTRICVCMCVHLWVCVWGGLLRSHEY